MRKYLLNRNFVSLLALWAIFISVPPSDAVAMPSGSVADFSALSMRQVQIDKILAVLSQPQARAHLMLMGVNEKELEGKLSRLDDQQLALVASEADKVKTGGDALGVIVILLVIAILVVVLIKLQNKEIVIKDKK